MIAVPATRVASRLRCAALMMMTMFSMMLRDDAARTRYARATREFDLRALFAAR